MSDFDGRQVVVTGGTGALGAAVVGQLVAQGARCVVPVYEPSELLRFPHREHPSVQVVEGVDLRDEDAVVALYEALDALWGSIHVVGGFSMAPVTETSLAAFTRMHDLNVVSCFLCCREAVRAMRRTGQGGRIVNVAARPALTPTPQMIAYATAKAAVGGLTGHLAAEVLTEGILVNAVAPSLMDTPGNRAAMPEADHANWPKVDDVARAMVHLASAANALTSGVVVPVYGAF